MWFTGVVYRNEDYRTQVIFDKAKELRSVIVFVID
jgi:hypothetical protein